LVHHVLVVLVGGLGLERKVSGQGESNEKAGREERQTHGEISEWYSCCVLKSDLLGGNDGKPTAMKQALFFSFSVSFVVLISGARACAAQSLTSVAATGKTQLWVASWAAAQQIPEPGNALAADDLRDATMREVFHLSAGGTALRVHLSNAFGTEALHVTAVHVARAVSGAAGKIDVTTDRVVTFAGSAEVTVPPGAEFLSDAVTMPVAALSDLAVSFYLEAAPARETGHPGSRATSFYAHGNAVGAESLVGAKTVEHWYQISEIDVTSGIDVAAGDALAGTVVALGDSITDGHGATTNGNDRWTDVLAARLQSSAGTRGMGMANEGIGGNHLLTDGLGPNALARFDRDVLGPAGVKWVIVFEGVNDLGGLVRDGEVSQAEHAALVRRVLAAYEQMVTRAHAHGLRVIGGTITPYAGSGYYHPGPLSEADRATVNAWIRAAGHFDAVVDFDAVVRDPARPDHLLPAYDCGDHLHPSPAGYKAMGKAVPLGFFVK
jgi:lysophospholipase L1-like esterase